MSPFVVRIILTIAIKALQIIKNRYERMSPEQKEEVKQWRDKAWQDWVNEQLDPNRESDR